MIHLPPNMTKEQCATWLGCTVERMDETHDDTHRALCRWVGVESLSLSTAPKSQAQEVVAVYEEEAVLCLSRWLLAIGRIDHILGEER